MHSDEVRVDAGGDFSAGVVESVPLGERQSTGRYGYGAGTLRPEGAHQAAAGVEDLYLYGDGSAGIVARFRRVRGEG